VVAQLEENTNTAHARHATCATPLTFSTQKFQSVFIHFLLYQEALVWFGLGSGDGVFGAVRGYYIGGLNRNLHWDILRIWYLGR
jgi:hypothetical protein